MKYLALVNNPLLIENCMKLQLKKCKLYENEEIYTIKPHKINNNYK